MNPKGLLSRFTFFLLALALLALAACEKFQSPTSPPENVAAQQTAATFDDDDAAATAQIETIRARIEERLAARQTLRAQLNKSNQNATAGDCQITVPDDYPTIQGAVDAATPGAKIKVKAGTYVESDVMVDVAGVQITAVGAVTLQGSFIVSANNVEIDHFTIVGAASAAIYVGAVSGVEIDHNEISNVSPANNVVLDGSTNCTVKGNELSGANFGIFLSGANGNTIRNNTCTNNGDGIRLNSGDGNEISGNDCSGNRGDGIELGNSSNNQLKDNTCNNNDDTGIEIFSASNVIGNNTISKNTANNNRTEGLDLSANNNVVKKNTFLNNGACDLVNEGINNTFIKNKAGCTSGV